MKRKIPISIRQAFFPMNNSNGEFKSSLELLFDVPMDIKIENKEMD